MHEAKLHRAKCLRLQGSENSFPTARSTPPSFSDAREAWKRAFSMIFRRPESSKRFFDDMSTSGGFGASIFEHFRRQKASERTFSNIFRRLEGSERAFSNIFDVWRLRSEDFRGFSRRAGPAPPPKSQRRQGVTSISLYR